MTTSMDKPTSTPTQPATEPNKTMHALVWRGKGDIRYEKCPRPTITTSQDALIRVTSSTICGSDLHLYHGCIPDMKSGDILGHECMGIVEKVGSEVKHIAVGQRVVVSCVIADGVCEYCQAEKYSLCDTTNPSSTLEKALGHRISGFFGYSHLTGGYPGGQAEFLRVPFADVNCLPVPDSLPDEKVLLLSDVLCTSWHANELGNVDKGSTVAIWGAGPIGLASAAWAKYRGASEVYVIDSITSRLLRASSSLGCHTIDFKSEDPVKTLINKIPGGPSVCIDAVGFRYAKSWLHSVEKFLKVETDSIDSLTEAIYAVKKGGTVVLIGDYIGLANHFPVGVVMEKSITLTGGQVYVQKYWKKLLSLLECGEFNPDFLITKYMTLDKGPEAYQIFDQKNDDAVKIILKPLSSP